MYVCFILAGASWASAACHSLDILTEEGDFQAYFICKNSLSSPDYTVSSYMGEKISFGIFSFDTKGASYMCHDYETKIDSEEKCTSSGLKKLKSIYKNKNAAVHMIDFGKKSGVGIAKKIFAMPSRYSTSNSFVDAEIEGCFVRVCQEDVYFGYSSDEFNLLSNCIIEFENEMSRNKKLLFSLL